MPRFYGKTGARYRDHDVRPRFSHEDREWKPEDHSYSDTEGDPEDLLGAGAAGGARDDRNSDKVFGKNEFNYPDKNTIDPDGKDDPDEESEKGAIREVLGVPRSEDI